MTSDGSRKNVSGEGTPWPLDGPDTWNDGMGPDDSLGGLSRGDGEIDPCCKPFILKCKGSVDNARS